MNTPSPLYIIPVLSTADIKRDLQWYDEYVGFKYVFGDDGYAGLQRDGYEFHLQFHHNNEDDPVLPGVIKVFVPDIQPYFEEFVKRGTIKKEKLRMNTPWGTHEFGFYDLNNNAIFIVQDA
ncbi:glyoxalase/bleomycin resistance/extradiol dioxygenase family protein [Ekhidna sp. To15]|uniref:glyoxalase/bleomycin resistance/extradiol dioxygenase family protein n=1 Tax=Ekhidna sp. To15 TaxID=3395267 RepID=UPI003F51AC87